MADSEDAEILARFSRTHHQGWQSGFIEGACFAIELIGRHGDDGHVMRELLRRFGPRELEREIDRRPILRPGFIAAQEFIATGDTQPIDIPPGGPGANSPQEVGALGQPGGWTGGLVLEPTNDDKPKGRRR